MTSPTSSAPQLRAVASMSASVVRRLDGPWRMAAGAVVVVSVLWRSVLLAPGTRMFGVAATRMGNTPVDRHLYLWSLEVAARGRFQLTAGIRTTLLYPQIGGVPLGGDTTILGVGMLVIVSSMWMWLSMSPT